MFKWNWKVDVVVSISEGIDFRITIAIVFYDNLDRRLNMLFCHSLEPTRVSKPRPFDWRSHTLTARPARQSCKYILQILKLNYCVAGFSVCY